MLSNRRVFIETLNDEAGVIDAFVAKIPRGVEDTCVRQHVLEVSEGATDCLLMPIGRKGYNTFVALEETARDRLSQAPQAAEYAFDISGVPDFSYAIAEADAVLPGDVDIRRVNLGVYMLRHSVFKTF